MNINFKIAKNINNFENINVFFETIIETLFDVFKNNNVSNIVNCAMQKNKYQQILNKKLNDNLNSKKYDLNSNNNKIIKTFVIQTNKNSNKKNKKKFRTHQ